MMSLFPEITLKKSQALSLDKFIKMDYYAVENYSLSIELMMENAGLHLAKLTASFTSYKTQPILILVGTGNNGGGGSVAARRLAAWGYKVHIKRIKNSLQQLPQKQYGRAIKFGAKDELPKEKPQLIIDAMLGFSQKYPLRENIIQWIDYSNNSDCLKVSLDLPTGLFDENSTVYFKPNYVLSLAAAKENFFLPQLETVTYYVADLGIPKEVYSNFNLNSYLDFAKSSIYKINTKQT